jgi:hypothetical protein
LHRDGRRQLRVGVLELLHALNLEQLDHLVVGDAKVVEIVEHGLLITSGATSSTTYVVSS